MWQLLIVLTLLSLQSLSQPHYTKVRAAFGAEIGGVTPQFAATAEAFAAYRARSFAAIQAGLGWLESGGFKSPSLSTAATYCYLLNPYTRKPCIPQPGYHLAEIYFEGGLAAFFIDPYDNNPYTGYPARHRFVTPQALGGVRLHFVSRKLIYMVKLRCTPSLITSRYVSLAGVGIGLGWR